MTWRVRPARPEEAGALSGIALAAKRHWAYPEAWIEAWRPALTITPQFVAAHPTYVAEAAGGPVAGFCALATVDGRWMLEHLWIDPAWMGRGAGRKLVETALAAARERGATAVETEADPHAEGFYARLGAVRVGGVRADVLGQERLLPRMRWTL